MGETLPVEHRRALQDSPGRPSFDVGARSWLVKGGGWRGGYNGEKISFAGTPKTSSGVLARLINAH
jgi:hypothetical protein